MVTPTKMERYSKSNEEQKLYRKRLAARLRQRRCRARKRLALQHKQHDVGRGSKKSKVDYHSGDHKASITQKKSTKLTRRQLVNKGDINRTDESKLREIAISGMLELSGKLSNSNDESSTHTNFTSTFPFRNFPSFYSSNITYTFPSVPSERMNNYDQTANCVTNDDTKTSMQHDCFNYNGIIYYSV